MSSCERRLTAFRRRKVEHDKVKAAQVLGIHLSTLYRKVQRYRLDIDVPMQQEPARSA